MDTFDSGVCHGAPFADPDGNRLQLHRRYAPLERFDVPVQEVERTDFVGVNVRDRARASEFYGQTLGLKRNPHASEEWPEFEAGERRPPAQHSRAEGRRRVRAGVRDRAPRRRCRGSRWSGFRARASSSSSRRSYDSGVCHMAFFRDPDGNSLILHHRYAPYRDGSLP